MPVTFYIEEFKGEVDKAVHTRMRMAAGILRDYIQEKSNRSQPVHKPTADMDTWIGLNPSAVGEFPKMVTERFHNLFDWEYDEATMTARIGSNQKYAGPLALGHGNTGPRPWATRGLRECAARLKMVFERGV